MCNWYIKNLGDATLADEALEHIRNLLVSAYARSHYPDDVAIFIRHESEGRLHCEIKVYFSPATAYVAKAVNAIACKKPAPSGMGLLAGSENAWSYLFPDSSKD